MDIINKKKILMEAEIWKDVSEYPDVFMISQYGRVYSKRRYLTPGQLPCA